MKEKNPLSPHIQIYNWHISSLISISHRITGIINIILITLICLWTALLLLGDTNYELIQKFFETFLRYGNDAKDLGIVSNSIENKMLEISKITNTEFICLTLGDNGVIFYDSKFHYQDAIKTKVLNTVGAGDSFLAMIIEGMISNISVKLFLKRAVNLSAYVCSKNGPNPEYNKDQF